VLFFAYYIGTEAYAGGTIGKKVMGLRVTKDGQQADLQSVVIRNVLRIVDGLPFLYLLGVITMAVRSDRRRIGDIVAGTDVVRTREVPAAAQS
jgi:uncharacterized RDD family membrane protein YckC